MIKCTGVAAAKELELRAEAGSWDIWFPLALAVNAALRSNDVHTWDALLPWDSLSSTDGVPEILRHIFERSYERVVGPDFKMSEKKARNDRVYGEMHLK